ncbi:MAG: hypothetical protein O2788_04415 [Chloroflexi bacterium]|nr:hypothetical protein [Chloroflexota bacterium]
MARRRIVRRKVQGGPRSGQAAQPVAQVGGVVPMTKESLGLSADADCKILVIGPGAYCSFTIARLGRLGISDGIGITASTNHAIWAVKNLNPEIVIASIDFEQRSGGIDLFRKLEAVNPGINVIVTSSAIDVSLDGRSLRDLAWSMGDKWSFVTRRKTDNGDPLGIAIVTARQGVGWIDYPVRKQLEKWRVSNSSAVTGSVQVAA